MIFLKHSRLRREYIHVCMFCLPSNIKQVCIKHNVWERHAFNGNSFIKVGKHVNKLVIKCPSIPLIGKDGDDVIDKITCELTGTEAINTQT